MNNQIFSSKKVSASILFLSLAVMFNTIYMYNRYSLLSFASTQSAPESNLVQSESTVTRGTAGDLWADKVIGKDDFTEIVPNTVVPNKLFQARSVIVDRSSTPNKMYIYEGFNSRILGINLDTCLASGTNPLNCTADLIIGQPSGYTSACNGDSGYQNYPNRAPASASTMCSLQESQLSVAEAGYGSGMFTDNEGNLYVTDAWNNRVLKYNSPFTTDTLADDVWGQADFASQNCNKGSSLPDATSLCFTPWSGNNNWSAGVDIDSSGNLWVNDSHNNRVVRYPPGSKTADLVLGQQNYTSLNGGSGLNQFNGPSGVRVSPQTGAVYVSDEGNNRILKFSAPFSNGMNGTIFGTDFILPSGLDINPSGGIWVANRGHQTYELWSEDATPVLLRTLGTRNDGNVLNNTTASIGIDSNNNIFAAVPGGNYGDDVVMFTPSDNAVPSKKLFGGNNIFNQIDGKGLYSANSVAIHESSTSSQLVVLDGKRIMFWNDITSLTSGKTADGVAEVANLSTQSPAGYFTTAMSNSNNYLYVGRGRHNLPARIEIYSLPLTNGAQFVKYITLPLPVLGGGQLNFPVGDDPSLKGVVASADDKFLWISDSNNSRVFRVRDPLTTSPVVDVILGQTDVNGVLCNRGGAEISGATPNSLCWPGHLRFDRTGNLFVSDHSLEIRGNRRLLVFDKNIFPDNPLSVLYAPNPVKIFPNIATWQPGFDSQNRMVIGFNPYWTANPQGGWFPAIYNNPLGSSTAPDNFIKDYYSMGYTVAFDSNDNLYLGDLDRSRVLIYNQPLNQPATATPTLIPTVPVPSNTPSPSVTPAPTATPPLPTLPAQSNLIINPGFEIDANNNNRPDNWSSNNKFTQSTFSVNNGIYSGRHFSSSNANYNTDQTVLNIIENTSYEISAWTNIPSTSDSFTYKIQLRWKNSSGSVIKTDTIKTYSSPTSGWDQASSTIVSPPLARTVSVRMSLTSLKGPIYVDDFSLIKI